MKKIIAITLTVITIVQLFTFSSFAMDNNPTINEVVEAVVADYSSTTTAAQKKILNKARAASSAEYNEEQEETPKKTSAIVEFFNKVAAFFKSIGDWFRNLFKKPEKPSPEPTPIKYYEPYADPDPTGEHIRENNYIASEPYVNTKKQRYGYYDVVLPDMGKIAPWVEPEFLNGFTKITYEDKSIHLGSTEDYMLYTFGKPTETITFNAFGNKEYVERIHIYASDLNNIIIFTVNEFTMGKLNFSYMERIDDIYDLYEIQKNKYNNNLPACFSSEALSVAQIMQTAVSGVYTNSDKVVFSSPGILRTDYTSVKSTATLYSYNATVVAETSSSTKTIADYNNRCNAAKLYNHLNINGNVAELSVKNQDLKNIHNLLSYNPENKTYSFVPHTSGNEMVVEYYFPDNSDLPCGINVTLIPGRRGISLGNNGSLGALLTGLSTNSEAEKEVKTKVFSYVFDSVKAKKDIELNINDFIIDFDKKINL